MSDWWDKVTGDGEALIVAGDVDGLLAHMEEHFEHPHMREMFHTECIAALRSGDKKKALSLWFASDDRPHGRYRPNDDIDLRRAEAARDHLISKLRKMASYPCNSPLTTVCQRRDKVRGNRKIKPTGCFVPCFPCWAADVLAGLGVSAPAGQRGSETLELSASERTSTAKNRTAE